MLLLKTNHQFGRSNQLVKKALVAVRRLKIMFPLTCARVTMVATPATNRWERS